MLVMGGFLAKSDAEDNNDAFDGDKYKYKMYSKITNKIPKTITVTLIFYINYRNKLIYVNSYICSIGGFFNRRIL
jgi:hypothetical protein